MCQAIFQSLAFQHHANSTVLAFSQHRTPCSCSSWTEHSLQPCSRENYTQINGYCSLFQVSISSQGRRTFTTPQNTPRYHTPLIYNCYYAYLNKCLRRYITYWPLCFLLPCTLYMQSYAYDESSDCRQFEVCVLLFTGALEVGHPFLFMLLLCTALAQCQKSPRCRNKAVFISSVFSSLPRLRTPPAAHHALHSVSATSQKQLAHRSLLCTSVI